MSEPSPPEKKSARKRAPTEASEDLQNSPTVKRTSKATSSAKKVPKLAETEGSEPHQLSEAVKTDTSAVEATKAEAPKTAPPALDSASSTSTAPEVRKPTPSTPKQPSATPSKSTGKSTAAKSTSSRPASSPSKSVATSPPIPHAPYDFTSNFEKVYQAVGKKNFLPHRTKKVASGSAASSIPPNDLDVCDTIRDAVEIVREHAMGEVLEVTFAAHNTIATSRHAMIHEMYTALSN